MEIAKSRQNIYIACEDMDLIWDEKEVSQFVALWNCGKDILSIAEHFNRDPDEIGLLVIDQARKGFIEPRQIIPGTTKSNRVVAKVERIRNNYPTVLSVGQMRFVRDHPSKGKVKNK